MAILGGLSSHGDIVFGGYDMMGFLVHAKSSRSMEGKMGEWIWHRGIGNLHWVPWDRGLEVGIGFRDV